MKKYIPAFVTLILTIVTPIAVLHLSYFKTFSSLDMFGYALGFGLVVTACFLFYTAQVHEKIRVVETRLAGIDSLIAHVHEQMAVMGRGALYAVTKEELYRRLRDFVSSAKNRIDLMYLGEKPPSEFMSSTSRDEYMKTLDSVIASKVVNIRRIILCNKHTKTWIRELAEKYVGNPKMSLSVLGDRYLHSLSIQVIDEDKVILINLNKSDTSLGPRDIIVSSGQLTAIFEVYYGDLFGRAAPIVTNGRKVDTNWRKYLE